MAPDNLPDSGDEPPDVKHLFVPTALIGILGVVVSNSFPDVAKIGFPCGNFHGAG